MKTMHLLAPNAITFPELVPDGYPYLFDNEQQQRAMLAEILETWPAIYNRWRVKLQDHARKNFNLDSYVDRYLDIFVDAEAKHVNANPKARTQRGLQALLQSMQKGERYTPMDLLRVFNRESGIGRQAVTSRRLVRELLRMSDDIRVSWERGVVLWKD